MKESFVLYTSQYEAIADLSVQQKGELFDALFQYVSTGNVPTFTDPATRMAFNFMRIQIDRDTNKYEDVCNKRREAVNKRWEKARKSADGKKVDTKVSNSKQKNTKDTNVKSVLHNDNDNDNDNDGNTKCISLGDTAELTKKEKEKKEALAVEENRFMAFLRYFNQQIAASGSSIRPCRELDNDRRSALRRIFAKYSSDDIKLAVRNIMYSNYANGRTSARKKAADLDWLLKPANFKHAFEGSL